LSGNDTRDALGEGRLVIEDEHGCHVPVGALRQTWGAASWLAGYTIDSMPRRSRTLIVRVLDRAQASAVPVAELVARNPAPQASAPALECRALPATESSPELELTLRSFETGTFEQLTAQRQPPSRDPGWTRVRYDITSLGEPTREWDLQGIDILDGAGTALPIRSTQSSPSQHLVKASPCIEEAWRVRFALVPHSIAAMERDEIWKIEKLALPQAGSQLVNRSAMLQGAAVTLIVVSVRHGATPGSWWLAIQTAVSGDFPEPAPQPRCEVEGGGLLEAADWHIRTGGPGASEVTTEFQVELPAGVDQVDITLALPRVRVVEIVARPTRAAAGAGE
jgi:hypothetical protein